MEVLGPLLASLRGRLEGFPDKRRGLNTRYAMADIGMAAFSVFFMTSPSFLEHQRRFEAGDHRSNCESLFGISKIPSDNHIRDMLDAASPERLHPVFADVVGALESSPGGLDSFRRLGGRLLIALDGTEYHCSKKISCPSCSTRRRGDEIEYHHNMLAATLVAPGHDKVIPLQPEFIVPQDGADKQDCESVAAKRWLAAHGASYAHLGPVYLGDDLFSRQPMCEAVLAQDASFLFVCKPVSHVLIQEYLAGVAVPTLERRVKRGKLHVLHRYRWMAGVPLRDGKHALSVNWLEMEILDAKGRTTYRNSWVTDLPVDEHTVVDLADAGRARWKIENETFNTLKNNGYNLEHNFGHGKLHLASLLASLNLLAFAIHTVCDIAEPLWRKAREKLGPRRRFFSRLASITEYLLFPSWDDLLLTLAFAKQAPLPP
jgi:hypothetical protein